MSMPAVSPRQTRWTLIPRGFDKKKNMQFTVVVSPTMASTGADAIADDTALDQTGWVNWYRTVAGLLKAVDDSANKTLFFHVLSDANANPMDVTLQSKPDSDKRHPNSSSAEDKIWTALWVDLTRTFPDHLEAGSPSALATPTPAHARVAGRAHLVDAAYVRGPAASSSQVPVPLPTLNAPTSYDIQPETMFAEVRAKALLAETLSKATLPRIASVAVPAEPPPNGANTNAAVHAMAQFAAPVPHVQAASLAGTAAAQHLEDARLYDRRADPNDPLRVEMRAEIVQWVESVKTPVGQDQVNANHAARRALRNLHRLSRKPFGELALDAMLYVYETQRSGLSGFTPNADFDGLRKKLTPRRKNFIDMAIFHRRCKYPKPQNPQITPLPVPAPGAYLTYGQFLKVLNTVGHYPPLLYGLGLAYDVIGDARDWSAATSMWLEFPDAAARVALNTDASQPRTRVKHGPYPADSATEGDFQITDGYLQLNGCSAVDYDIDAIALATVQQSDNPPTLPLDGAGGAITPPVGTTPSDNLPMKSAGLTILPPKFALTVNTRSTTQAANRDKSSDKLSFTVADLVRGFAPEVTWRKKLFSLTARGDQYDYRMTSGDVSSLVQMQENHSHPIQIEAAYAPDYPDGASQTQYHVPSTDPHIAPSLWRWRGWSLLLRNPFEAAGNAPKHDNSKLKFPVSPTFQTPIVPANQLPSLRYGEEYIFQAPGIDIAGNPIATPPGAKPSTLSATYTRHDPIPAPLVLAEASFDPVKSPGEQIDVMVVRIEDDNHQPLRYLCPPVSDLQALVEQGALDDDEGNLRPPIDDGRRKGVGSFADVKLDSSGDFPVKQIAVAPATDKTPAQPYNVPIFDFPQPGSVPSGAYLPDSYAVYGCFQLKDIATGKLYPVSPRSFYERADELQDYDPRRLDFVWPRAAHVQVQLTTFKASEPTVRWARKAWNPIQPSFVNARLEIDVPAGWQMELQLSCAPNADQATTMAPVSLATDFNTSFQAELKDQGTQSPLVEVQDVKNLLLKGISSLYTPYRPVNLVAAVKCPRHQSYFADNTLQVTGQTPDSALATFSGTIHIEDARATGMLDVYLGWVEYIDDATKPSPTTLRHIQHLGQFANCPLNGLLNPQDSPSGDIENDLVIGDPAQASSTATKTSFKFPDTRHLMVDVWVNSISRFVGYYPAPTTSEASAFTLQGKKLATVSVLNTSLPDPPTITRIKPLFPKKADRSSQHTFGGAMRIHFARGIYSAGEKPMIGVVVADDQAVRCGDTAKTAWLSDPLLSRLYTRWGLDPTRDATGLKENTGGDGYSPAPKAAHFNPPSGVTGFDAPVPQTVHLAESQTQTATILTYIPVFTPEDGWYCDIILNSVPTYGCFLRLALVLYQRESLDFKKVSLVSLAAFVQLRADRSVTLLPTTIKHQLVLAIDGTMPGLDVDGVTTTFSVSVEIHDRGMWITDPDIEVCAVSAKCPAPPLTGSGNPSTAGPLLAEYVLKVNKHHHRERRLRIAEFEARRTYDPVTLADVTGPPALVYAMEPLVLPHL
jgi:hypothetical protein